jgi:hypothetical protein
VTSEEPYDGVIVLTARTIVSLSQYFALQEQEWLQLLFGKHNVETYEFDKLDGLAYVRTIQDWLTHADDNNVEAILAEVVRTQGSFRNRVTPRYVYDERYEDLRVCLALDGYLIERGQLLRTEPTLDGAAAVEDDLARALQQSGLPEAQDVDQCLARSVEGFRQTPPDLNGALTNARVALQTLATAISRVNAGSRPTGFDESKWGQVAAHLRTSGVISKEEETGLAGVFTFVSPGAHTPVGLSETEMVRLGRSLVVSMCYFLVKRYNG